MHAVELWTALLLVVVAGSVLARVARLPAPVLLAVVGVLLGLVPAVPAVRVDPAIVQGLILPPLLFAAASEIPVRELRRNLGVVAALALGLVAAATVTLGYVATLVLPGVTFGVGLVLGAMLSATDPVAVAALSRRLPLPSRLQTIANSESLLNDATSLVAYRVAVAGVVAGGGIGVARAAGSFVVVAGGGVLVGLLVGLAVSAVRRRLADPLAANTLMLAIPFLAFLPAEALRVSGVTAVVVCGLTLAAVPIARGLPSETRLQGDAVWAVVVFALEGLVFLLIGLELPTVTRAVQDISPGALVAEIVVVTVAVLVIRVVGVFATAWAVYGVDRRAGRRPPSSRVLLVLAWSGTRGVVALAASLALPLTVDGGGPFPQRDLLVFVTTGVTVLTLVVQGPTLAPLVRALGVVRDEEQVRAMTALARHAAALAARTRLDDILEADPDVPEPVGRRLHHEVDGQADRTRVRLTSFRSGRSDTGTSPSYRELRARLLDAERQAVVRLRDQGEISEQVLRDELHRIDLDERRLAAGSEPA